MINLSADRFLALTVECVEPVPPDQGPTITITSPGQQRRDPFPGSPSPDLPGTSSSSPFLKTGAGVGMPGASIIGPVPAATACTRLLDPP